MKDDCYRGKEIYPHLFTPIRIGNIRLKNRIIAAPTSPSMITTEGHFTPQLIAYLEEKAKGGAAVVTYGEAIVHSATGKSHNKQLQLDSFGVRQGMAEAARAIHNAGAYANIQLSHGGKYGGLTSIGGDQDGCEIAYGPSPEVTPVGEVLEMSRTLILEIVDAYKNAAVLCKDCGFDMVQVHAAHGWLFSQFLSPVTNMRTDEFGGSLENRARFLLMVLDAVREGVGRSFPIEIRLSGDDLTDAGLRMQDCVRVAQMVEDRVDLYNISCGNHEDPDMFCRTHPSTFYPRGINVQFAAEIKKHISKPVACVGALNDPAHMERIIAEGQSDIVELGRALLADPLLPAKALAGRADNITPCLRCFECFGETYRSETVKCSVNPTMGQQLSKKTIKPRLGPPKKVLVIGGGPAGLQAAITAAECGHTVTLVEKSDKLGGNLHAAGAPFFKDDVLKLCEVLIRRLQSCEVKVLLNTEGTPEFVQEFQPDTLFVAIGAKEIRPNIKGIDLPHVVMAIEAEMNPERLGHRVAIMGGGLVGAETAISLHQEGKECSIIEMKDAIASDVTFFYRGGLMPQVNKAATTYTGTTVQEIVAEGVLCRRDGREFIVPADSVVCALGFYSPYTQVDALCEKVQEYHIIGDCSKVGQIYDAISQSYYAALNL